MERDVLGQSFSDFSTDQNLSGGPIKTDGWTLPSHLLIEEVGGVEFQDLYL